MSHHLLLGSLRLYVLAIAYSAAVWACSILTNKAVINDPLIKLYMKFWTYMDVITGMNAHIK